MYVDALGDMDSSLNTEAPPSPLEGATGKDGENAPPGMTSTSEVELKRQKQAVKMRVERKKEVLRKLEMVKMYRSKVSRMCKLQNFYQ